MLKPYEYIHTQIQPEFPDLMAELHRQPRNAFQVIELENTRKKVEPSVL